MTTQRKVLLVGWNAAEAQEVAAGGYNLEALATAAPDTIEG